MIVLWIINSISSNISTKRTHSLSDLSCKVKPQFNLISCATSLRFILPQIYYFTLQKVNDFDAFFHFFKRMRHASNINVVEVQQCLLVEDTVDREKPQKSFGFFHVVILVPFM